MRSKEAKQIIRLLQAHGAMDGSDIEEATGLSEAAIKAAAVQLHREGLITTSGAPDSNEPGGMAIDRLEITRLGQRAEP